MKTISPGTCQQVGRSMNNFSPFSIFLKPQLDNA